MEHAGHRGAARFWLLAAALLDARLGRAVGGGGSARLAAAGIRLRDAQRLRRTRSWSRRLHGTRARGTERRALRRGSPSNSARTGLKTAAECTAEFSSACLTPQDLRSAYFPGEAAQAPTSNPQTIALVDAYNDPKAEADLRVYSNAFGLPAIHKCSGSESGCFEQVSQTGTGNLPFPKTRSGKGNQGNPLPDCKRQRNRTGIRRKKSSL